MRHGVDRRLYNAMVEKVSGEPDIPIGINLVNYDECIKGYYLDKDGNVEKYSSKTYVTNWIRIIGGLKYQIRTGLEYSRCNVVWYDQNKEIIEIENFDSHFKKYGLNWDSPASAYYVRFNGYMLDDRREDWGSIRRI